MAANYTIEVRNNNVEKALRVLKKKLMKDGVMRELKERQYFHTSTYQYSIVAWLFGHPRCGFQYRPTQPIQHPNIPNDRGSCGARPGDHIHTIIIILLVFSLLDLLLHTFFLFFRGEA